MRPARRSPGVPFAFYHGARGHYAEARKAIERALSRATAAGDERMQNETRAFIGFCLFKGDVPARRAFLVRGDPRTSSCRRSSRFSIPGVFPRSWSRLCHARPFRDCSDVDCRRSGSDSRSSGRPCGRRFDSCGVRCDRDARRRSRGRGTAPRARLQRVGRSRETGNLSFVAALLAEASMRRDGTPRRSATPGSARRRLRATTMARRSSGALCGQRRSPGTLAWSKENASHARQ